MLSCAEACQAASSSSISGRAIRRTSPPVKPIVQISLDLTNTRCPQYGAPLVVLGAPLTIDAGRFKTATGDLEASLKLICDAIHPQDIPVF
jgi:3-hexulose-6-phosphate synthase